MKHQYRLYKLIWDRFVASQMSSAVFDAMRVDLAVDDYIFRASGSQLKFPGFLKLYQEGSDTNSSKKDSEDRLLPPLEVDEEVQLQDLNLQLY